MTLYNDSGFALKIFVYNGMEGKLLGMNIILVTILETVQLAITGNEAFQFFVALSAALGNSVTIDNSNQTVRIPLLFVKNQLSYSEFNKFCAQYSSLELWQFYSKIGKINEGGHYFLIPTDKNVSENVKLKLKLQLIAMDMGRSVEELEKNFNAYLSCIVPHYAIVASYNGGGEITKIGHLEKMQRMCRFCGRTERNGVTFRKKAHAISELLGNKAIVLCDECDECNGGILNKMEDSLATYFKAVRSLVGVYGKHGIPACKQDAVEIRNTGGRHVGITISNKDNVQFEPVDKDGMRVEFKVECGKYVPLHIYRLLSKFALSVLPDSEFDFKNFERLRKWILGEQMGLTHLPLVAVAVDGSRPPQYPQITIYKRKDQGDERLPLYLVEFYAVAHRFMYELPFLEEDSKLTSRDEWRYLFSTIPSFGKIENWNYDDFSADAEMTLSNNIVFESKNRRVDNA